jgi:hypothetical protein
LWLAFATPNYICDGQAFRGIVPAEKHSDEARHFAGVVFTHGPSAKRTDGARIVFTEPTFHKDAPGLRQV